MVFGKDGREISILKRSIAVRKKILKQLTDIRPVKYVHCREKMIALTFDDGYEYTKEILEKLRHHHVKATFFMVGDWVEQEPALCRKVSEAGHEIGNHSYSHCDMTQLSRDDALVEIKRAQNLIGKITGKECTLVRFPYNKCNMALMGVVKEQGLHAIGCSFDSFDWTGIEAEMICKNVLESKKLKRGAIVLMHTNHYNTVEALDQLIPVLKRKGYQLVRVSDMLVKNRNKTDKELPVLLRVFRGKES